MTAIIALCHFCEFHGPSIVMLTQPHISKLEPFAEHVVPSHVTANVHHQRPGLLLSRSRRRGGEGCDGCWSLSRSEDAIVSNDEERCFVSSQSTLSTELQSLVRHVSIRSISCEVSVINDNVLEPVLFSDPSVATVFSQSFFLRDVAARGFQRYYSVVVISRERHHLVMRWRQLSQQTHQLVNTIKEKAERCYKTETANNTGDKYVSREESKPARNLRQLTDDQDIFLTIHRTFVKILQQVEKCLSEVVLLSAGASLRPLPGLAADKITRQARERIAPKVDRGRTTSGPSLSEVESLCRVFSELGVREFTRLARCVMSGMCLCVVSDEQTAGEKILSALALLVPSTTHLAGLTAPPPNCSHILRVAGESVSLQCAGVNWQYEDSMIVTKLVRILSNKLPLSVKQLLVRLMLQQLVCQARVFGCISSGRERSTYLHNIGLTRADQTIFTFFSMYSNTT